MFLLSLPAKILSGDKKGQDSFVDVKSAKMTGPDGKPIQYQIPAQEFQYPQFGPKPIIESKTEGDKVTETEIPLTDEQAQEGIDEAIVDAGGKVKFLDNYNSATRTAALNGGKGLIRTKETGSIADIIAAGLTFAREFSWAKADKLTNKEVREQVEALENQLDSLSGEELKARLRAILGK